MPTPLTVTQEFPAEPAAVYALFTDRAFLEGRLADTGALDPEVVALDKDETSASVTTRQSIPASALPSMVSSMMAGDPATERIEQWKVDGDSYVAEFTVTVKGAPASLKGTMTLAAAPGGSALNVDGSANVPIPMFGGKIEQVIVEQIGELLAAEGDYTRGKLAG